MHTAGASLYEWISRHLADEQTWHEAKARHASFLAELRKRLNL